MAVSVPHSGPCKPLNPLTLLHPSAESATPFSVRGNAQMTAAQIAELAGGYQCVLVSGIDAHVFAAILTRSPLPVA